MRKGRSVCTVYDCTLCNRAENENFKNDKLGDNGDINGSPGSYELAIYTTKDKAAGAAITADIIAQKGSNVMPANKSAEKREITLRHKSRTRRNENYKGYTPLSRRCIAFLICVYRSEALRSDILLNSGESILFQIRRTIQIFSPAFFSSCISSGTVL